MRGQHQCLVAEINLDAPAPQIATGIAPANSDKLAQRNLTIVGVASPHQVPVTFDIKPTAATLAPGETPDELLIDWGGVPAGTKASMFLPGTSADAILETANRLYLAHGLARVDAQTIALPGARADVRADSAGDRLELRGVADARTARRRSARPRLQSRRRSSSAP